MQISDFVASTITKLLAVRSVVQCSKIDIHWIAQSDKEVTDYLSGIADFEDWIVKVHIFKSLHQLGGPSWLIALPIL